MWIRFDNWNVGGVSATATGGPNTRNSSKIYDLENEPGHIWGFPEVSRVTRDHAGAHGIS